MTVSGIIIPHPPVVDALEIDKLSNQKTMMKRLVQSQMVEVERDWQRFAREGTSAKLKSFIEDRSLVNLFPFFSTFSCQLHNV